jgi:predicted nucleic acid-binding protein
MKTKFNIKIISNPMQLNEFENKIQLEKKIKKTNINQKKFNIKIK